MTQVKPEKVKKSVSIIKINKNENHEVKPGKTFTNMNRHIKICQREPQNDIFTCLKNFRSSAFFCWKNASMWIQLSLSPVGISGLLFWSRWWLFFHQPSRSPVTKKYLHSNLISLSFQSEQTSLKFKNFRDNNCVTKHSIPFLNDSTFKPSRCAQKKNMIEWETINSFFLLNSHVGNFHWQLSHLF